MTNGEILFYLSCNILHVPSMNFVGNINLRVVLIDNSHFTIHRQRAQLVRSLNVERLGKIVRRICFPAKRVHRISRIVFITPEATLRYFVFDYWNVTDSYASKGY